MNRYGIDHFEVTQDSQGVLVEAKYVTFTNRGSWAVMVDDTPLMPGDQWQENAEGCDILDHRYQVRFLDDLMVPANALNVMGANYTVPPYTKPGKFLQVRLKRKNP